MTESEALVKLQGYCKCQKLQVKGIYEDCNARICDDCDLCYMQGTKGEHIASIEIAIKSLEKQIPKKPMFNGNNWYRCVNGCEIHKKQFEKDWYCPNCGQKLDWS